MHKLSKHMLDVAVCNTKSCKCRPALVAIFAGIFSIALHTLYTNELHLYVPFALIPQQLLQALQSSARLAFSAWDLCDLA